MLAMRQTFQQWMVLLSALVLLLLPALLCHARPMEGASSSSGPRAEGDSKTREYMYYFGPYFELEEGRQPLTRHALDEDFGTHIHYQGVPVLDVSKVPKGTVKNALVSYKKVWLFGTTPGRTDKSYGALSIDQDGRLRQSRDIHENVGRHFDHAESLGLNYGEKARYLMHGRPFDKRTVKGWPFRYSEPSWRKVQKSDTIFDLENSELAVLRNHLNNNNYLKASGPPEKGLLGFRLNREGVVFMEELARFRV